MFVFLLLGWFCIHCLVAEDYLFCKLLVFLAERVMFFDKLLNSQRSTTNGIANTHGEIARNMNFSCGAELCVCAELKHIRAIS